MTRWVRNHPERGDDARAALVAVGVGAAVGAVLFYLMRIHLARDPLPEAGTAPSGGAYTELAPGREE